MALRAGPKFSSGKPPRAQTASPKTYLGNGISAYVSADRGGFDAGQRQFNRSIERMTGIHRDTIMRLGVRVGQGCQQLMDEKFRNLDCSLIKVDVCLAPKFGDTIQRVGYILVYEHNTSFADTWMVHSPKGWQIARLNFTAEMDIEKTFAAIPAVYFN